MENGSFLSEDYFERLLEEIREIRLSERRFYQKITGIYATSLDYEPIAPTSRTFFATVQNRLHYAIHEHTAAELIAERANSTKPNIGLATWEAKELAVSEFEKFRVIQDRRYVSDFDRFVRGVIEGDEASTKGPDS